MEARHTIITLEKAVVTKTINISMGWRKATCLTIYGGPLIRSQMALVSVFFLILAFALLRLYGPDISIASVVLIAFASFALADLATDLTGPPASSPSIVQEAGRWALNKLRIG